MLRKTVLAAVVALACAGMASAATLSLSVPGPVNPGDQVVVSVTASGVTPVDGFNLMLVVGDGGDLLGGTMTSPPAPEIIAGNSTVYWAGSDSFMAVSPLIGMDSQVAASPVAIAGPVVICTFTLQTKAAGTYALSLNPDNTNFTSGVNYVIPDLAGTQLVVTPEPAALALLALGGLFIRRR